MKSIKFANGREFEILECYNHGRRYIHGETRNSRDFVLADGVIGLDELKALLTDSANLATIQVYINEDREIISATGEVHMEHIEETETLENFVYADEIKDTMQGEVWFTLGEKTALEIENQQAMATIDTLLIAMEV